MDTAKHHPEEEVVDVTLDSTLFLYTHEYKWIPLSTTRKK